MNARSLTLDSPTAPAAGSFGGRPLGALVAACLCLFAVSMVYLVEARHLQTRFAAYVRGEDRHTLYRSEIEYRNLNEVLLGALADPQEPNRQRIKSAVDVLYSRVDVLRAQRHLYADIAIAPYNEVMAAIDAFIVKADAILAANARPEMAPDSVHALLDAAKPIARPISDLVRDGMLANSLMRDRLREEVNAAQSAVLIGVIAFSIMAAACIAGLIWHNRRLLQLTVVLKKSQLHLQAFMDNVPSTATMKDGAGRYLSVNSAAAAFFGHPAQDMLGHETREFCSFRGIDEAVALVHQALATGRSVESRLRYQMPDGQTLWHHQIAFPIADGTGRHVGVGEIGTDVTEQVRHEQEIEESRRLLHLLIDSLPFAIGYLDSDQRYLFVNETFARWNGCRPDDAVGKYADDIMTDNVWGMLLPHAAEAQHNRKSEIGIALEWADGATRHVEASFIPHLRDNRVIGIFVVVADVTERHRMEDHLREAQKMEAVGQLTGGIAHDFNNLLSVVIGNLDLLVDDFDGKPGQRDMANLALEGALRGAELTRQLLAFSRRQALTPRNTDINTLLEGMVRLMGRTLGENIEIDLKLGEDLWPVMIDPGQLDSAIVNLSVNARDAMPQGGILTLATRNLPAREVRDIDVQPGDYVLFEVGDAGTGIPTDNVAHIFEPFFTTKEPGKGTGLGLAMVYGFIKQSGGHISVDSEVGRGTTFRLYLPRGSDARESQEPSVSAKRQEPTGRGERILVVEDNDAVRRVAARHLAQLGYAVSEAQSGVEALHILETDAPDIRLVFSDVVMAGGVSGVDLNHHIANRWPAIKVLLTSGYTEMAINSRAEIAADIIAKPYRMADLAHRIRETLDA